MATGYRIVPSAEQNAFTVEKKKIDIKQAMSPREERPRWFTDASTINILHCSGPVEWGVSLNCIK